MFKRTSWPKLVELSTGQCNRILSNSFHSLPVLERWICSGWGSLPCEKCRKISKTNQEIFPMLDAIGSLTQTVCCAVWRETYQLSVTCCMHLVMLKHGRLVFLICSLENRSFIHLEFTHSYTRDYFKNIKQEFSQEYHHTVGMGQKNITPAITTPKQVTLECYRSGSL